MDNKKVLFKLLLANIIVSVVVYALYFLIGSRFQQPHEFPIMIIPYAVIMIVVISITGLIFQFENKKETWIICNVLAIVIGLLSSVNICFLDNTLIHVFTFPFIGVNMLCEFSIGMEWIQDWKMLILSLIIFILCQNLFLLPMVIKYFILKRNLKSANNNQTE